MVELFAAAVAIGAASVPHATGLRCETWQTTAIVAGRRACLWEGGECRVRHQKHYRKYGFFCRHGSLEYDWARLHRWVQIPRIAAGALCPASAARRNVPPVVSVNIANAFGPGPAYPTLGVTSGRAALAMVWAPTEPPYLGWAGTKVLWTVPNYKGPVLIRGRRVDGADMVGFDLGPGWTDRVLPEIQLVGPEEGLRPAATFVHAEGCYAYQVDTLRSSYRVVFEVRFQF